MKNNVYFGFLVVVFLVVLFVFSYRAAFAQEELLSAKNDYITCWKQPCVLVEGSIWSEKNPNGVAVSVAMGTKPLILQPAL